MNWRIAGTIPAILLLALAAASGTEPAPGKDTKPVEVRFSNPFGVVHFSHEDHSDFTCSRCHPPFDFNYDPDQGYSLRAHTRCIGCHKEQGMETECASCHRKPVRTERPYDEKTANSDSKERQKILSRFYGRRSIRKFTDKPVPREVVEDLLKAAMAAPSAGSWQPWRFLVVTEQKTRQALADTSPFAKYAADAPVVIVVFGQTDNRWAPYDCALAAGYLLLAGAQMGLGATYCGLDPEREKLARQVLDIPGDYYVHSLIPLGYPAEKKAPHTKYNPDLIHWEKFNPAKKASVVPH